MKTLTVCAGRDYALSLVHFLRHGRYDDRIYSLDDDAEKVLDYYMVPHVRATGSYNNVYLAKVLLAFEYQRECGDIVLYHDIFCNFSETPQIETLEAGLTIPRREDYWPDLGTIPISKMFAVYDVTEDMIMDFRQAVRYRPDSGDPHYDAKCNGFDVEEIVLDRLWDREWLHHGLWHFKKNIINLEAGHVQLYGNMLLGNKELEMDTDLYNQLEGNPFEILKIEVAYEDTLTEGLVKKG